MLMALRIKELNVFPVLRILTVDIIKQEDVEDLLKQPDTYFLHLKLLIDQSRFGRNILQEFIDRELTPKGMSFLSNKLMVMDRAFERDIKPAMEKGQQQEINIAPKGRL